MEQINGANCICCGPRYGFMIQCKWCRGYFHGKWYNAYHLLFQ